MRCVFDLNNFERLYLTDAWERAQYEKGLDR